VSVHHVDGFVNVLYEFFESLLSDKDAVCFEETENIKAIAIMPEHSLKVALGLLEILVYIFACDDAKNSSIISYMLLEY